MDFRAMAEAVQPEVVAFRRDLHEHPEASFQEFRTTEQIAKEMDKLGIPYRRFEPTRTDCGDQGRQAGQDHCAACGHRRAEHHGKDRASLCLQE